MRLSSFTRFILITSITSSLTVLAPNLAGGQDSKDETKNLKILNGALSGNPSKRTPEIKQAKPDDLLNQDSKPLWPTDDAEMNQIEVGDRLDLEESSATASKEADFKDAPAPDSVARNTSDSTGTGDEWKLDLAKTEYARDPSDSSLTEVLSAYSELINSDCFANKRSSCSRLIEESLKLDPFFTPAICAQHGVESTLCLQSYGSLSLGIVQDSQSSISRKLTLNLDEGHQSEMLRPMQEQRWNLMRQFNQNQTQQGLADILKLFFKELAMICNREQFYVESIKKQKDEPSLTKDPLTTILLSTPTPTPIPGGLARSRRITKSCFDLADEALSFAPDFSSAVCAKFGRYSPKCNQSLRNAQRQKKVFEKTAPPSISSQDQTNPVNNDRRDRSPLPGNTLSQGDVNAPVAGGLEEF